MKKIAIITARSGSQGLKNKNILPICGKPMLAYSVEAAVKSKMFDRVILSTDSLEYGKIGEEFGAEVIYRDEKASTDTATTFMAIEDVFSKIELDFDYFMLLQPTSPLRNENHVIEACEFFESRINDYDFLVSMQKAHFPAILVRPIEEDCSLKYFDTDFANYRRQNCVEYSPNGALYIAKPNAYLKQKHFYGAKSLGYIMTELESIDVDTELDYEIACLVMKKYFNGED